MKLRYKRFNEKITVVHYLQLEIQLDGDEGIEEIIEIEAIL